MGLKLERAIVFFDLESTGIKPLEARIVQFTVIRLEPGGGERTWKSYVNPGCPMPQDAYMVNGISDDMLADAPAFAELADELATFFDDADLGGYNVLRYDIPLLAEEFARVGITFEINGRQVVDVYQIFRQREPHTLSKAVEFYCGKRMVNAHDSEADIRAALEVLNGQLSYYGDLGSTVADLHAGFSPREFADFYDSEGKLRVRNGQLVVSFGRYRGELLADVVRQDRAYIEDMAGKGFSMVVRNAFVEALGR